MKTVIIWILPCIGRKVVIESPIGLSFIYKHRVLPFSKTKQILWFVPQITAAYEGQFFSIIICLFLKTADGALCKQLCFLKSGYFDGNMSGIFMVCFPSMILRTTSFVETQCIQWGGDSVPQFLLDHPGMTLGVYPMGDPARHIGILISQLIFTHSSEIFHQCGTTKQHVLIL